MINKIALVTGGNRGLGLGVVKLLLEKGCQVVLTARDEEKSTPIVEELKNAYDSIHFCQLDVISPASIEEAKNYVEKTFGHLDILINNAAINYDTWQSVINADIQECHETMEVNLFGPWMVAQAFFPLLKMSKFGRVVNVSSGAGAISADEPGTPAYSISKAALNMLTIKLAHAGRNSGILVNSVCPGWVRTAMGGQNAPRSIREGAESIVWAASLPDNGPTGGFYRDGKKISW